MASGLLIVDSFSSVTAQFGDQDLVSHVMQVTNMTPALWGRYFSSVASPGGAEYRHVLENQLLSAHSIGVLPLAQQTRNVSGAGLAPSAALTLGRNDGVANAVDFFATFGVDALAAKGSNYYIFLDVEGGEEGSLSPAYYNGWSVGLQQEAQARSGGRVVLSPCLYLTQDDAPSWNALRTSHASGATCAGVWIASWIRSGRGVVPDWTPAHITPPGGVPADIPLLFWQYASDFPAPKKPTDPKPDGFDYSQTNPDINFNDAIKPYFFYP